MSPPCHLGLMMNPLTAQKHPSASSRAPTDKLTPAPKATDSHWSRTGSSCRQYQLKEAFFFPARTTRISQAGTIIHGEGVGDKEKHIKKLIWDLFVWFFCCLFGSEGFFTFAGLFLIHVKLPNPEFCQGDGGDSMGIDTHTAMEQQNCPREGLPGGESNTDAPGTAEVQLRACFPTVR